jgi:hypothetical protein
MMTNITQQEIIEIAKEAGFAFRGDEEGAGAWVNVPNSGGRRLFAHCQPQLHIFAQLIEARLAARSDDSQSEPDAIRERDRLGYAVVNAITAIENLIEGAIEYEGDDGNLHQGAPIDLWSQLNDALEEMPKRADLYLAAPQQAIPAIDVNKMVDRFLGWKLPSDFSPDAGINFNKLPHLHDSHEWPIGTNLLTAPQAKAMFEYVLSGATVELAAPQQAIQADKFMKILKEVMSESEEILLHDTNYVAVPFEIFDELEDVYDDASAATTAPIDNGVREAYQHVYNLIEKELRNGQDGCIDALHVMAEIRALIPSTQAPKG